jgi:glycosyltransferase involved in cell wall biosynthesis
VSSLPEAAGDAAVYVDPRDPDDIAAAMARLLDDPELRADLSARGRARAATFTWERALAPVLRAYREA